MDSTGGATPHGREVPPKAENPPKNRYEFLMENWDGAGLDQIFQGNGHSGIPSLEWGRGELSSADSEGEECEAYQAYLSELKESAPDMSPLNHIEFHLLEAELEMLVGLETRVWVSDAGTGKGERTSWLDRLFIDPDFLLGGDWDQDDQGDVPFWNN